MAPTRRRPATSGGGAGGTGVNPNTKDKAPLSLAENGSPGLPVVISPRGAAGAGGGVGVGNASHHKHHHNHSNHNNLTSLDLDALDDEAAAARFDSMSESVVKIFCIHSEPAFNQPWTKRRQTSSTSSGFAIPGRRILTNAHSVEHHVSVKCRRRGSDAKVVARVLAIGVECDLALLAVDDDDFWCGLEGVTLCKSLPRLQESVSVCGFPLGGDTLSVTSGVVSRCETTSYVHSGTGAELLAVQIDAAVNSGNSGGPVFNGRGECVGVAFQSMAGSGEAEGIGWIIPAVVVLDHFLEDFRRNGRYTGFPCLGVEWQKMESPSLRAALGMNPAAPLPPSPPSPASRSSPSPSPSLPSSTLLKGVYVRKVEPTAPAAAVVRAGDVLLAFDDVAIGVDGTVPFRSGERISYSFLVSRKFIGDRAKLRLLRDGKVIEEETELAAPYRLVPAHLSGRPPSYFVFGGLVFTALSAPYLRATYGKDFDYDSPLPLLTQYMLKQARSRSQQVVVLSQVLASQVSIGIEEITDCQVHRVNGQPIDSLRSLVRLLEGLQVDEEEGGDGGGRGGGGRGKAARAAKTKSAKKRVGGEENGESGTEANSRYARFELDYDQLVVLDVAAARRANDAILRQHSIAVDRSADLLADDSGEGDERVDGNGEMVEGKGKVGAAAAGGGSKKRRAAAAAAPTAAATATATAAPKKQRGAVAAAAAGGKKKKKKKR